MSPVILVVDDKESFRLNLERYLKQLEYEVVGAGTGEDAVEIAKKIVPDVILLDLVLPGMNGIEVLKQIKDNHLDSQVIIMTAHGSVRSAVQATKIGAVDYLEKPFDLDKLKITIQQLLEKEKLRREVEYLREEKRGKIKIGMDYVVGRSKNMEYVYDIVAKVARSDTTTVLIQGESGTGKELIANLVHYQSPRAEQAFLEINCAAIPENLLESELFGYEPGAFTGAKRRKLGLLELADGGTLFLDEIGDMHPNVQVKLLRVLETRKFKRVGGTKDVYVNLRIIAATNRDLKEAVRLNEFREDLYYRLNVMPIQLPPLRDRKEDILLVARAFLDERSKAVGRTIRGFTEAAKKVMLEYNWPGNIRELKNVIERAVILCSGSEIGPEHLFLDTATIPIEIESHPSTDTILALSEETESTGIYLDENTPVHVRLPEKGMPFNEMMEIAERAIVEQALALTHGNQVRAAKLVGVSRQSFRYRMNKFGIRSQDIMDSDENDDV
ncbi:MAG: sigma-54-dependent Fis family transcriptional regulator [Gemmatimonadetes bacterium]|nr:MAG: sigma-54-dependent Fis family transcriptional regulator [Gemmatimonadota bacterium]